MRRIIFSVLSLLSSSLLWADMSVTVNVNGLAGNLGSSSSAANLNNLSIHGVGSFIGNKTFELVDGEYEININAATGSSASYGRFAISGTTLTVQQGALTLINDNTLGFDTSQLTRVELDTSELISNLDGLDYIGPFISMTGSTNTLRGRFFVHLPDNNGYRLTTRKGDLYGTFDSENGNISNINGRIYLNNSGKIQFDKNQLAPVLIMDRDFSNPQQYMMIGVQELTPSSKISRFITYMPPGTHHLINRSSGGSYGKIVITDDLQISTTAYLLNEYIYDNTLDISYTQINLDHSIAPYVDIYWSELSEPAGLSYGELKETANGVAGHDFIRFYIADRKSNGLSPAAYTLSKYTGKHITYGELTSSLDGLSANGALLLDGSSIHFDTCALYKLSFTPAAGEVADVDRWSNNIIETTSFFAPIGTPFKVRLRASDFGSTVSVTATVTENGLELDGSFNGRLNITSQAGHCVPPDSDGDLIIDELDECPETASGDKVDNYGCSVTQNINLSCDPIQAKNHGRYIRCVSHVLNDLIEQGLLSSQEKGQIMSNAAQK